MENTTVLAKSEALKKKAKGKKGFTLVELVIVIAVLAIIAGIAIPAVTSVINNANSSADSSNAQAIELAIKTAQSEVAAQQTTKSDRVTTLKDTTKTGYGTLKFLLNTYGVNDTAFTLKVNGNHFYYDSSTGKVTAAASAPTGATGTLDTNSKYSINNDALSVSATALS